MATKQAGASPRGRKFQGLTPQERAVQRRAAILGAALEVFGTQGYAGSSVKQICRVGGLTERYFYESFTDREGCLADLYGDLVGHMRAATLAAVESADSDVDARAQAGLNAFIGYLTDDPRRARVVLIEVIGVSSDMEKRRHGVLREFADIVATIWGTGRTELLRQQERLTAVALVGGVNHLLVDWLMSGCVQRPIELAQICGRLFSAARQRLATESDLAQ